MKITSVTAINFGSYKNLEFNFDGQGLTLISGSTGAGKSTLCDLIPWALFGVTAKNGSVDEVLSWNQEGPTTVEARIRYDDGYSESGSIIRIFRQRGKGFNDLWFDCNVIPYAGKRRGKDLADTQKQIDNFLGFNAETYLAGAYYHEFSPTAQFFQTNAKSRRKLTEELVDLSLASELTVKIQAYNKELKKDIESLNNRVMLKANSIKQLEITFDSTESMIQQWKKNHISQLIDIEYKFLNYEQVKAERIQELINKKISFDQDLESKSTVIKREIELSLAEIKSDSYFTDKEQSLAKRLELLGNAKCGECGGPKNSHKHHVLTKDTYTLDKEKSENSRQKIWHLSKVNNLKQLETRVNPYVEQIEAEKLRDNSYLAHFSALKEETNPYAGVKTQLLKDLSSSKGALQDLTEELEFLSVEQSDLDLLSEVIADFRGTMLTNTLSFLQNTTNSYLEKHFDAEIRVRFSAEDADKIEVTLTKDGNTCSFTQLSKGQRQLLKLCFGLSVMKQVSNFNGTNFNAIFLDECTDGLDEEMKLKVFNLLSSMEKEYSSIFLVEHSESLKACFDNKISVILENGVSKIGVKI